MTTRRIQAFDAERTNNARLVADLAALGFLKPEWPTWDATYGLGRFWQDWRPDALLGTDLDPERSPGWLNPAHLPDYPPSAIAGVSVDFTDAPWADECFGAVVFDPPYKLNGTSTGEGASASDDDYGVAGEYVRWQDRHALIRDGITECARVLASKGFLIVKCQDQVCSGRVRWQTVEFSRHAETLGFRLVDMLHVFGSRAQPAGRAQKHAGHNYSTALVLRKERKPKP